MCRFEVMEQKPISKSSIFCHCQHSRMIVVRPNVIKRGQVKPQGQTLTWQPLVLIISQHCCDSRLRFIPSSFLANMAASVRRHVLKALVASFMLLWATSFLVYLYSRRWDCRIGVRYNVKSPPTENTVREHNKSTILIGRTIVDRIFDGEEGAQEYKKQKERGQQLQSICLARKMLGRRVSHSGNPTRN